MQIKLLNLLVFIICVRGFSQDGREAVPVAVSENISKYSRLEEITFSEISFVEAECGESNTADMLLTLNKTLPESGHNQLIMYCVDTTDISIKEFVTEAQNGALYGGVSYDTTNVWPLKETVFTLITVIGFSSYE